MNGVKQNKTNGSKTVLVVEDSPVQALAMIQLFELHGLRVLCAPDGLAGVGLAKNAHPDAIILDVKMPAMNGLEACQLIKQDSTLHDTPVIFLTAHTEPETVNAGMEAGASAFVVKDAFSDVIILKKLKELKVL